MNKIIKSITEVDLSAIRQPVIAIYYHPEDFPEKVVARIFDMDKPTEYIMLEDTADGLAKDIHRHTGMVFFKRGADDIPSLLGVWA